MHGKGLTEFSNHMLYRCTSLENVTIENTVTSIDKFALTALDSMTEIAIPDSVTELQEYSVGYLDGAEPDVDPDIVLSGDSAAVKDYCKLTGVRHISDGEQPDTSEPDTSEPDITEPTETTEDLTIGTEENPEVGDVNLDGEIGVTDMIYLQRYLMGTETMNATQLTAMDADGDGAVNAFDLAILKRMMLAATPDPIEPTEVSPEEIEAAQTTVTTAADHEMGDNCEYCQSLIAAQQTTEASDPTEAPASAAE